MSLSIVCAARTALSAVWGLAWLGDGASHLTILALLGISVARLAAGSFQRHGSRFVAATAALGFAFTAVGGFICSPGCGWYCDHRGAGRVVVLLGILLLMVSILEDEHLGVDEQRRDANRRAGQSRVNKSARKSDRAGR